ncbi:MAG: 50S ribosomal protein L9 [Rhizobiaceae bacterium]|jgi:large subunit ribosomal protein L9|nr:50S ribosomal protein L9 [Rhizobiaceae bacterium]
MQVILLERVAKLGHMGDVVNVKDGFARNYLLPMGKALRASDANKKKFEGQRADLEARNEERKTAAAALAKTIDGQSFIVVRSAGETGQLYGSVSARDIADILVAAGHPVNRNHVDLNTPIKAIGVTAVPLVLHPDVVATISVNVARTTEEAARQAAGENLNSAEAIYGSDINDAANPETFVDEDGLVGRDA